ncbi:beta and beta-prime subunits of DNA dependent RNA-polymerase [Neocallimastix lanati (nom. inval.)]|nr:beta and beta-prime subunits of DNA dependent RNA-polymerase [Neocallimastix sp. JGI-2020a]
MLNHSKAVQKCCDYLNILCYEGSKRAVHSGNELIDNSTSYTLDTQLPFPASFSVHKIKKVNDSDVKIKNTSKPEMKMYLLKNIPVLPINLSPSIKDSNNITIHNNITHIYIKSFNLNHQYHNENSYLDQSSYVFKAYNLFQKVLGIPSITDTTEDSKKISIKQMLSGKTGIFRSMCLAKRQNFCLRRVIVRNINTALDTILIPKEFTDQLIPFGYKPYDYVIINRQPTLQTTSLLAVSSYPSDSLTIEINPLITSVFQVDFDEKLNIANNILSFKNGSLMIKFIQDTLTRIYNMTKDTTIVDSDMIKKICKNLKISKRDWTDFTNQLLNAIYNYGNNFYLKFMWDVQRMVHEYNLTHLISLSIADCIPSKELQDSVDAVTEKIIIEAYTIPTANIDSVIVNNLEIKHTEKTKSFTNNLTNIVNSGSKENVDNIIQILMSVGIQTLLPNCYIKTSYLTGISPKELFIHSKSGRFGIISTSLSTYSTVKCMEDLLSNENSVIHDYRNYEICYYPYATNTPEIKNIFLEYAYVCTS